MKSQKKPRPSIKYSSEQEKKIYGEILKGKNSSASWTDTNPRGSSKTSWDNSSIIDVGDGSKIRVWEVDGKLTYPTDDPHFAFNKLYKEKFATALKNYKKKSPSIEKIKTQSGKEIYRRTGSSFSGEL